METLIGNSNLESRRTLSKLYIIFSQWTVVEFDTKEISTVPVAWLLQNENQQCCMWPKSHIRKHITKQTKPADDWEKWSIITLLASPGIFFMVLFVKTWIVFRYFETVSYHEAIAYEKKKEEETSDTSATDNEKTLIMKRKRKRKKDPEFTLYDDDDEDQKHQNARCISPPPKICVREEDISFSSCATDDTCKW